MRYVETDQEISIGDRVVVGPSPGLVVCDFEKWVALPGYEDWLIKDELVGGGHLASGVMIETQQYGFIHYPEPNEEIVKTG